MPHIFGTGLVALDLIIEHRPHGSALSASGGGTCGNVLAILARMGWTSSWLGSMESSRAGRLVRDEMERAGVGMHSVRECDASPAPVFAHHVRLSESGESAGHWFSHDCPHCAHALPRYERPADIWLRGQSTQMQCADVFFVDRLSEGALELAATAHDNGALVAYEPSVTSDEPWLSEMLALADVVKYSYDRRGALHDVSTRSGNDRALWIETHGHHGLRWWRGDDLSDVKEIPALRNFHVVDTCGAGDWFTSALLFGLGRDRTKPFDLGESELTSVLEDAARLAAWSCSFLGARGALYEATVQDIFAQFSREALPLPPSRAPLSRPIAHVDVCDHCSGSSLANDWFGLATI